MQISSYVTGDAFRAGRLKPILAGFQIDSPAMWVMYPQNRHLTPRVRAFVDFLVEAAQTGGLGGSIGAEPSGRARSANAFATERCCNRHDRTSWDWLMVRSCCRC